MSRIQAHVVHLLTEHSHDLKMGQITLFGVKGVTILILLSSLSVVEFLSFLERCELTFSQILGSRIQRFRIN